MEFLEMNRWKDFTKLYVLLNPRYRCSSKEKVVSGEIDTDKQKDLFGFWANKQEG